MTDYERILQIVRQWPAAERLSLLREVTQTLSSGHSPLRAPRDTLSKALGLLSSRRASPSDQEIEHLLDEHRMEKYG